jgi:molybdopterin-containing oxidoreductase family iron-sulfur binding subunit
MRGVMEKCTYCIQRLKTAKIDAKVNKDPSIIDNVQTACQQACPSRAIAFGNINNKSLESTKLRSDKRSYLLLQKELNTKPRTVYLSKIVNPVWSEYHQPTKVKGKQYGHS